MERLLSMRLVVCGIVLCRVLIIVHRLVSTTVRRPQFRRFLQLQDGPNMLPRKTQQKMLIPRLLSIIIGIIKTWQLRYRQ